MIWYITIKHKQYQNNNRKKIYSQKINCNEKYKSIGNYCFNYIENLMKPFLKSLYIPYEIENLNNKFFDKKTKY